MGDGELIATNEGYTCRYYPTVGDGPVFRWTRGTVDFEVSASRNGVMVSGRSPLLSSKSVDDLCQVLDLAQIVAGNLASSDRQVQGVKEMIVRYAAGNGETLR